MLTMVQAAPAAAGLDSDPGRPRRPVEASLDPRLLRRLELLTAHLVVAVVALVVIGGATRVMQAGLACPDWPLCYGVLLPGRQMNLQVFLEWFHRLDAFVVGVGLLVLWAVCLVRRASLPVWLPWGAGAALLLVAGQGALGALTVLQLLAVPVVTAHLLTALLLLLGLSALHQAVARAAALDPPPQPPLPPWWSALVLTATLALFVQCAIAGVMASQWAAPRCFAAAEACGWLLNHRLAATPAAIGLLSVAAASLALPAGAGAQRRFGLACGLLVLPQLALGVLSLRLQLAVPAVTVAHQLIAALMVGLCGALLGSSLLSPAAAHPSPSSSPAAELSDG